MERYLNTLYAKGYLNDAYDFYQENIDRTVARGELDGQSFIITEEGDGFQLNTFTNDEIMQAVETVIDFAADIVWSEAADPYGYGDTEGSDVELAAVFPNIKKYRDKFLDAFPAFLKIEKKMQVHHRIPQIYRDIFGDGVDNLSNLIALPIGFHEKVVTPLWAMFKSYVPNPTQKQVYEFAKTMDQIMKPYANNIQNIKNFKK